MTRRRKRHERWARGFALLLVVVVSVLLARYARSIDWPAVGAAVAAYGPGRIAAAAGLGMLSYLLVGGYELAARTYVGHHLSTRRIFAIALISYAFNMNLGALVGGGGVRYRLYSRSKIRGSDIARIIAFSVTSNWLGYLALAGTIFALGLVALPDAFAIAPLAPRILGIAMLVVAAGYLFACARYHDRLWTLRGRHFSLPSPALAVLQLALSTVNWATIAALLFVLLPHGVDYPSLLGVVLAGAIAAAITHIPAGLGALEAVFLALLGARIAAPELLAALLVYRAIYYLVPLLLATVAYLAFEGRLHLARP